MSTHYIPGLYVWNVTLEGGATRELLSTWLPPDRFGAPITAATRGPAYVQAPPPTVTGLVPASAPIGAPNFTLHVQGTGFRVGDVILWNGVPEPTTLVSPTELTTLVDMTTAVTPMPVPVAVRAITGYTTSSVTFTINPAQ